MSRKKNLPVQKLLTWMCEEMRPALTRPVEEGGVGWCKVDCIRTAKMALALLKSYQIPAKHLPLSVLVANIPISNYLRAHKKSVYDLTKEEVLSIKGARFFRMGRTFSDEECTFNGGWRGHMAIAVADKFFLDLTIDSGNIPADQIVGLRPFWLNVGSDVLNSLARKEGEFIIGTRSGVVSTYRGDPENQAYTTMDAWTVWHDLHTQILQQCQRRFKEWRNE